MIQYPEIYAKAQKEVDRVVGHDRLPDFDDRESLPYINRMIKEAYRYALILSRSPTVSDEIIEDGHLLLCWVSRRCSDVDQFIWE